MSLRYLYATEALTEQKSLGFFAGWPHPPSPDTHLEILQNSDHVVSAYDDKSERVVGFINAIGDGILSAYIPLLEVPESHQGRGIGGELVRRMLDRLDGLYMIDLLCDPELEPFYARFGLCPGFDMVRRDYARQSGC